MVAAHLAQVVLLHQVAVGLHLQAHLLPRRHPQSHSSPDPDPDPGPGPGSGFGFGPLAVVAHVVSLAAPPRVSPLASVAPPLLDAAHIDLSTTSTPQFRPEHVPLANVPPVNSTGLI